MTLVAAPSRLSEAPTLIEATEAFLDQADLARSSLRVYRASLAALRAELGPGTRLSDLEPAGLSSFFALRYGNSAPATWNRELAVMRSASRFWISRGFLSVDPTLMLERRREHSSRTRPLSLPRPLSREQVEALWRRDDVGLREQAFWCLLYESGGRASDVLALDVVDLDFDSRRAPVHGNGGTSRAGGWMAWQDGAGQYLASLVLGRASGPVFLADRRPTRTVSPLDLDAQTGRARLSYRRAAQLFHEHTGWTLHQLRRSSLAHAAGEGASVPAPVAPHRRAPRVPLEAQGGFDPDEAAVWTTRLGNAGRPPSVSGRIPEERQPGANGRVAALQSAIGRLGSLLSDLQVLMVELQEGRYGEPELGSGG